MARAPSWDSRWRTYGRWGTRWTSTASWSSLSAGARVMASTPPSRSTATSSITWTCVGSTWTSAPTTWPRCGSPSGSAMSSTRADTRRAIGMAPTWTRSISSWTRKRGNSDSAANASIRRCRRRPSADARTQARGTRWHLARTADPRRLQATLAFDAPAGDRALLGTPLRRLQRRDPGEAVQGGRRQPDLGLVAHRVRGRGRWIHRDLRHQLDRPRRRERDLHRPARSRRQGDRERGDPPAHAVRVDGATAAPRAQLDRSREPREQASE